MSHLLAGVMGCPVHHSLSPRLHGYWLEQLGIEGSYLPLAVSPDRLGEAVRVLPALGFRGANVTIPHKEAVIPFLDELGETAKRIGAVNTIVVRQNGSLFGDSTDGTGFMAALRQEAPQWKAGAVPVVVLGAGGAARAVVDVLHRAGVPEFRLVNRTRDRAEALAHHLGVNARVFDWGDEVALEGAGLLINTTSLGMVSRPPMELELGKLLPDSVVFDLVYNPLETGLLREAAQHGFAALNGLGMLLHQAVPGFEAWFGIRPSVTSSLRQYVEVGL